MSKVKVIEPKDVCLLLTATVSIRKMVTTLRDPISQRVTVTLVHLNSNHLNRSHRLSYVQDHISTMTVCFSFLWSFKVEQPQRKQSLQEIRNNSYYHETQNFKLYNFLIELYFTAENNQQSAKQQPIESQVPVSLTIQL